MSDRVTCDNNPANECPVKITVIILTSECNTKWPITVVLFLNVPLKDKVTIVLPVNCEQIDLWLLSCLWMSQKVICDCRRLSYCPTKKPVTSVLFFTVSLKWPLIVFLPLNVSQSDVWLVFSSECRTKWSVTVFLSLNSHKIMCNCFLVTECHTGCPVTVVLRVTDPQSDL